MDEEVIVRSDSWMLLLAVIARLTASDPVIVPLLLAVIAWIVRRSPRDGWIRRAGWSRRDSWTYRAGWN